MPQVANPNDSFYINFIKSPPRIKLKGVESNEKLEKEDVK